MNVTDESIQRLIDIWENEFGIRLTMEEARIEATRLMDLVWLLAQPLPGEPGHDEPMK